MKTYKPLYDNIVVKPVEIETQTSGGIYIPMSTETSSYAKGEVVAVGEGRIVKEKLVPLKVKPGDIIIYRKMTEIELTNMGEKLYILTEGNVLAIEEEV